MKRGNNLQRKTRLAPGKPLQRAGFQPKHPCGATPPLLLPSDTDDPKRVCRCGSSDTEWGSGSDRTPPGTPLSSSLPPRQARSATPGTGKRQNRSERAGVDPVVGRQERRARARTEARPRPSNDFTTAVRRIVAERSGGCCEDGCGRPATDVHHRRLKGRRGYLAGTELASNALHLARACHSRVHSSQGFAGALADGVVLRSFQDPAAEPVFRRGEWVLLAEDGSYERCSAPEWAGVA